VDSPDLWSPDSPTLYNFTVKLGSDTIQSYTGFRTISTGVVNGVQRPLLNGEFIFQFGTLDQGFWPDGIYTPPTREAMIYDLQILKKIGYNMVRKHVRHPIFQDVQRLNILQIKVENPLWFKACDELGLLVFQDMPSLRTSVPNPNSNRPAECVDYVSVGNPSATVEFGRQLEIMIEQHKSYPSIVTWVR
jgi:beta-galactosidase/beta-glucuronidase